MSFFAVQDKEPVLEIDSSFICLDGLFGTHPKATGNVTACGLVDELFVRTPCVIRSLLT